MKKLLLLNFIVSLLVFETKAQNSAPIDKSKFAWSNDLEDQKAFIENKGQFWMPQGKGLNSSIYYAVDQGQSLIYFTKKGLTFHFRKKNTKGELMTKEEIRREMKEHANMSPKEYLREEAEEKRAIIETDVVNVEWLNANPNPTIIADEKTSDYYSYSFRTKNGEKNENNVSAFRKIIYKDLYKNIDVEYVFHAIDGIKYSLILHPGADITQVKMKYSDAHDLKLEQNGDIKIPTKVGDIRDHAPLTFYEGDMSNIISSKFIKNGKVISFELGIYDHTKTIVVDPWTQTPSGLGNSNKVWECEKDGSGNAYIIGGDTPMKLLKYNTTGVLQWTYVTPWDTANGWLGTFATDLAGNSYVTNGSSAAIKKISTAGAVVWSGTGGSSDEYWNITFNCDQSKLIVGGTRLGFFPPAGSNGIIFDINTSNGNVTAVKKVGYTRPYTLLGFSVSDINEVRSITSSKNAKYYYLTLDSVGYINQGFSLCNNAAPVSISSKFNLSYKCEDYRVKGNSGIMSIRANGNFVYTQNGNEVEKRSLSTLAIITTVSIPGGINTTTSGTNPLLHQVGNSGLDIDSCGNVYVGSGDRVIKYDANLNLITSVNVGFRVFDVSVSYGGDVIVAGSPASGTGSVRAINMSSCNPMTLICCDASFCQVGPFCSSDAAVTLTPSQSGGTWTGPGVNASTGVFTPATAGPGNHVITYTLACGSESHTIVVNACASLTVCQNTNGTLTVSGGTPTYTWEQYNPAQTTTVTNQAQCTACGGTWFFGNCTVQSCATPAAWGSMGTGTTVTPSGVYPIRVTDSQGGTQTYNTLASIPSCNTACPTLTVTTASVVNVSCNGGSTGSFSVSTSGGASPYDYTVKNVSNVTVFSINNIAGSQAVSGLPAGTYTITVNDNNNCPGTQTVTITEPPVLSATTSNTPTTCGLNNGTVTATPTGGTSTYTYSWNSTPVQTTQTATALPSGNYTVTVTDFKGCTTTANATVVASTGVTASATGVNASCGVINGTVTANATGGTGSFTYSWNTSPVQTTQTATGLGAGTYTATVTSGACSDTAIVTITASGTLVVTANPSSGSVCTGGSAVITASGATTYSWTPSTGLSATTGASVTATPPATITYTVTGTTGACNDTAQVTITVGNINVDVSAVSANVCSGSSTTITATGATNYSWSPATDLDATTGATVTATPAVVGSITYTVTGTSGTCTDTAMITITSGNIVASITPSTVSICPGGTASLSASGAGAGGTYTWTPNGGTMNPSAGNTANITVSPAATDTYTLTANSTGGCSDTAMITVNVGGPTATITSYADATCGASDGTATVSASGGTGTYIYSWSPSGGSTATGANLAAGTYTVTVSSGGCSDTAMVVIGSIGGPIASISSYTNTTCGTSTGSATASATGGNGTYTYAWSPIGTTNASVTNMSAGTFTVTVTSGGCSDTAMVVIGTTNGPTATITASTNTTCGTSTGSATASASGGNGTYTYSWSPSGGSAAVATNLAAGTYTVTVTSGACSDTAMVIINTTAGPVANITAHTNVNCFGALTGTATGSASGGNGTYTYGWTPSGGSAASASGLAAGTYTLTVTSGSCSDTAMVIITQPAAALSATASATAMSCGSINGTATANPTGGTSTYTYSWNTTPVQTTQTATGLSAGTYTVTVTDNLGCVTTATATVGSSSNLPVTISGSNIICNGSSTTLTANASGATTFAWNTSPVDSNQSITVSPTGPVTYTVTATDGGTCSGTATVTVTVANAFNVAITGDTTICKGESTTLSATSGASYLWSPGGQTTQSITVYPNSNTTYSVVVYNSNPAPCNVDSASVNVHVGGSGNGVNAGPDQTITIGQSATLTATNGGNVYVWNTQENGASIVVTPKETTTYWVTSADVTGCNAVDTVVVYVDIKCGEIFVPTGFSPNDDGMNDFECVFGNCIVQVYFAVYDRWGERVFETTDPKICWDGTYRGKPLNTAVFVYKLEATLLTGEYIVKKGNITLTK